MARPKTGCDCGADEIPGASCQFPNCQAGYAKRVEAAAGAMMGFMFAPHELPLDGELRDKYLMCAVAVIEASDSVMKD